MVYIRFEEPFSVVRLNPKVTYCVEGEEEMLRIAIVEDEMQQAQRLLDFVERYSRDRGISIESLHFKDGLTFLEEYREGFDVVFLDIGMPVMDGMECAHRLRERDENILIIFVTNMAQYAIKGYEVDALAYMLKPVLYEELAVKLDKVLRIVRQRDSATYTIIRKDATNILNIRDIIYIEVFDHNLVFHTADAEYEVYGKLSILEEDTRFTRFVKISKSHLVNCAHITTINKDTLIAGGKLLPLTRRRRKECLEKTAGIMGGKM